MALTYDMDNYIKESQDELKQLIKDLCAIPAPSHHEEKRAEFCKKWFEKNGGRDVIIDETLNVICPYNMTQANEVVVIMAHMDTVFPDIDPMPLREEGNLMYCPGITDDTANLAVMMLCARYIMQHKIPTEPGILFVANSCEEGLGNLKGSRAIVKKYGQRMKEFITLDGTDLETIVTQAVGSHRYKITIATEGGHSFRDFGRKNAIQVLSSLVDSLYQIKVPAKEGTHTTYNVGMIRGGTSINTIAQSAEMLYEYRSDDRNCLEQMKCAFMNAVNTAVVDDEVKINIEMIGERPCSGEVRKEAHRDLIEHAQSAVRTVTSNEAVLTSGSTDCNVALKEGIPAICLGVCAGGDCHTREEWLDTSSLEKGCQLFFEFFQNYIK